MATDWLLSQLANRVARRGQISQVGRAPVASRGWMEQVVERVILLPDICCKMLPKVGQVFIGLLWIVDSAIILQLPLEPIPIADLRCIKRI